MTILPIHLLAKSDETEFGRDYVFLSHLSRLGFPVAEGVVISAPNSIINLWIKDFKIRSLNDFEINSSSIKNQLLSFKVKDQNLTLDQREQVDFYWSKIVKTWLNALQSHFLRFGQFDQKHFYLPSQSVYFVKQVKESGLGWLDEISDKVVVEMNQGELGIEHQLELDQLVRKAQKKIGLSYKFHFVKEGNQILFTKITPHAHRGDNLTKVVNKIGEKEGSRRSKRKLKLFSLNQLSDLVDGVIVDSSKYESVEEMVVKITQIEQKIPNQTILFGMSNSQLREGAEVVLFCRNQKKMFNLEVGLPEFRTKDELLETKRTLAAWGISRKGSLKFWLQISTPAQILGIEELIDVGVDGVMINLDNLITALTGRPEEEIEQLDKGTLVKTLTQFLVPSLKILAKNSIFVILSGNLVTHDEVINLSIKNNLYGLLPTKSSPDHIHEYISYQEQLHLRSFL